MKVGGKQKNQIHIFTEPPHFMNSKKFIVVYEYNSSIRAILYNGSYDNLIKNENIFEEGKTIKSSEISFIDHKDILWYNLDSTYDNYIYVGSYNLQLNKTINDRDITLL